MYVCVLNSMFISYLVLRLTVISFQVEKWYVLNNGHLRYATCMCTFLGKKLSYDLNSYYWRVVMTNKDNMMINIMIVKAVIKKNNVPVTCFCKGYL